MVSIRRDNFVSSRSSSSFCFCSCAMPSWKMPSIWVDCSGESASVGSLFHQNQFSCCWADAAAANDRTNTRAANRRQSVGIIGNLKEKRFFVEEYDEAH